MSECVLRAKGDSMFSKCIKKEYLFVDKVNGKDVFRFYLKNGKSFMAHSRFATFRIYDGKQIT